MNAGTPARHIQLTCDVGRGVDSLMVDVVLRPIAYMPEARYTALRFHFLRHDSLGCLVLGLVLDLHLHVPSLLLVLQLFLQLRDLLGHLFLSQLVIRICKLQVLDLRFQALDLLVQLGDLVLKFHDLIFQALILLDLLLMRLLFISQLHGLLIVFVRQSIEVSLFLAQGFLEAFLLDRHLPQLVPQILDRGLVGEDLLAVAYGE